MCGCEGVGTVCRWVGVREGVWVCAPCILCLIFTLFCVLTKDKGGGGASYGSHATMLRY